MNRTNFRQRQRGNGANKNGQATPATTNQGLFPRDVLLSNEDPATWEALRNSFQKRWQPQDEIERLLVDDLAAAKWKLLRAESIETALLCLEMDILAPEIDQTFRGIDEPTRQALAFKSLADNSKAFAALERHQARLHRDFQRTSRQLAELPEAKPAEELSDSPVSQKCGQSNSDASTPIRHNPTHSDTSERIPATPGDQEDSPPCRAA